MNEFLELALGNTLTRLVFFPAAACLPLLFLRRDAFKAIKGYTFVAALAELALGILYAAGHAGTAGTAFASSLAAHAAGDGVYQWIPGYGIRYQLAADGISMPLVLLTVLLLPLVVLGSFRGIERHWRAFGASLLLLTTGLLGALLAADLFLFYVFWEVMLVPMYMLIGIWGGERRIYAAVKFFLFTMAGSLLMLIAILWMGFTFHRLTGAWSFAYADLLRLNLPLHTEILLFAGFALTFAIKVPMFPFHTWLPDAHVEAPTGGSVILAGIMLKLGTYGFLRFALPLFPRASLAARPLLVGLALAGILYGALVAWVQVDMKKLVAYSSIAHLGFVMLGLLAADSIAWQGALLQMINHGLSTGALFLLVGMIYDRRHTKQFAELGGLAKVMPVFAFFLVFSTLASVGLPLLNGFAGEFLILVGSYRALGWPAAVATFGVVLAAIYLMKMLQQTIWGPITKDANRGLTDLSAREVWTLIPLCVFMLWIGVAPNAFLQPSRPALNNLLASYKARLAETPPAVPAVRPRNEQLALAREAGR
ncbi:MAG: NADH-quinone oxidoreductase subunit [Acidobacteriota bacterium]|jgi:NADH-quinone oxidoreductase subunit M|nr:NADH-quinone oxidoreductase subunit [Acidobacteriota bacterium]